MLWVVPTYMRQLIIGINSLDELVAIDQLELEEQETSLFREDAPEDLEDLDN